MSASRSEALYFDGIDARGHAVTVSRDGCEVEIAGVEALRLPVATLAWASDAGAPKPLLRTPDGGELLLSGSPEAEALGIARPELRPMARARRSLVLSTLAAAAVLAVMLLAVAWAIPRSAQSVAYHLPWQTEIWLGEEALRVVDRSMLAPTELAMEKRQALAARFSELSRQAALAGARLELRRGRTVGPSAFALPGRIVVVTDELVRLLDGTPGLDAVLAHELGHAYHRHGTRALLRRAELTTLAAVVIDDQRLLARALGAAPQALVQAAHSRDAEREADAFAFTLLDATGGSPADFAEALRRLEDYATQRRPADRGRYFASHPATPERIEAARKALR